MELKDFLGKPLKPNNFYVFCNESDGIFYYSGEKIKETKNQEQYLEVETPKGKSRFYSLNVKLLDPVKEAKRLEKIIGFLIENLNPKKNKANLSEQDFIKSVESNPERSKGILKKLLKKVKLD